MKLKLYLAALMLIVMAGLIPISAMAEEKKSEAKNSGEFLSAAMVSAVMGSMGAAPALSIIVFAPSAISAAD